MQSTHLLTPTHGSSCGTTSGRSRALTMTLTQGAVLPSSLEVTVVRAAGLIAADSNGKSDPYVVVDLRSGKGRRESSLLGHSRDRPRTEVRHKTLEPRWDGMFNLPLPSGIHHDLKLCFTVMDSDMMGEDDFLGHAEYPLQTEDLPMLISNEQKLTMELLPRANNNKEKALYYRHGKNFGKLEVCVRAAAEHNWVKAVTADGSKFTLEGIQVTLKDAEGLRFAEKKNTRPVVRLRASPVPSKVAAIPMISSQPQHEKNPIWGDVFRIPVGRRKAEENFELTFTLTSKDQKKFVGYKQLLLDERHLISSVGKPIEKSFMLVGRPNNDADHAEYYRYDGKIGIMTIVYRAWGKFTPRAPDPEPAPTPKDSAPVPMSESTPPAAPAPTPPVSAAFTPPAQAPELLCFEEAGVPSISVSEYIDDVNVTERVDAAYGEVHNCEEEPRASESRRSSLIEHQSGQSGHESDRRSSEHELQGEDDRDRRVAEHGMRPVDAVRVAEEVEKEVEQIERGWRKRWRRRLHSLRGTVLGKRESSPSGSQPRAPKSSLKSEGSSDSTHSTSSNEWEPSQRRSTSKGAPHHAPPAQPAYPTRRKMTPPQDRSRRDEKPVLVHPKSPRRRAASSSKALNGELATEFGHLSKAIKDQNEAQAALMSLVSEMPKQRTGRRASNSLTPTKSPGEPVMPRPHRTIHIDKSSLLYYTHDPMTGKSEWLTQDSSPGTSSSSYRGSGDANGVRGRGALTAEALGQLL